MGFGRNEYMPGRTLAAAFLESSLQMYKTHTFSARYEEVEKDELFPEDHWLAGAVFKVSKISGGYMYSFPDGEGLRLSLGGSLGLNILPPALRSSYGESPVGFLLFLRLEPAH